MRFTTTCLWPLETWKDVVGFEGTYQVSNIGRVRSLLTGNFKKTHIGTIGYRFVYLWKHGVETKTTVHRVVAEAFSDRPEGKNYVLHSDGDSLNNLATNLRWGTQKENMQDARTHGTIGPKELCKQGHPLTPDNLYQYTRKDGRLNRMCKTCQKARSRKGWQHDVPLLRTH